MNETVSCAIFLFFKFSATTLFETLISIINLKYTLFLSIAIAISLLEKVTAGKKINVFIIQERKQTSCNH